MSENLERLGNYILLEKINAGGMAEVYLSKSVGANGVNKFLAIKRILPQFADNRDFIEMFKEEAKIAVNLAHNNVVSIIDFKAAKNQLYLVMEYVQGQNLRQILQQKKKKGLSLSLDFIVYVIREVAAGLEHAHRCVDKATGKPLNIIHRDMSPQNIMISYDGEVKIVDFGIAKAEATGESTRVGTLKGKFSYMSPEQAEGLVIDKGSDIFSLGIILWELIADDRLFAANNEMNILKRIKECDIPDLRRVNSTVPVELERIVKKALMKDKTQRYQSTADLQKDLSRFLNREYPDFTPNDFSHFMKFLFENEYALAQERLVNYSKLDLGSAGAQNENTQYTKVMAQEKAPPIMPAPKSLQKSAEEEDNPVAEQLSRSFLGDGKEAGPVFPPGSNDFVGTTPDIGSAVTQDSFQAPRKGTLTDLPQKVSLKEGTASKLPRRASVVLDANQGLKPGLATRSGVTTTGIRYKTPNRAPTSELAKALGSMILLLITASAIYFLLPKSTKNKIYSFIRGSAKSSLAGQVAQPSPTPSAATNARAQTPEAPQENTANLSSTLSYRLIINSTPGRARIYVDDTFKGLMTPAQIEVPAKKSFTLTLLANGYLQHSARVTPESDGQQINVDLIPIEIGYININVLNAGLSTKVFVDNLEVGNGESIKKFPIQAGKPTRIKAIDQYSGQIAEQMVLIQKDEKKIIDLILAKPARNRQEKNRK
ncbi:MAG: hypothetical protein RJB66_2221 [Pseudomonadota bacterium]